MGIKAELLIQIYSRLEEIKPEWVIEDYVQWSFKNHIISDILTHMKLEGISSELTTIGERKEQMYVELALDRLQELCILWIRGSTLQELEESLGTTKAKLGKCVKARKFVRWSPYLSYALGVVTRLYRIRCNEVSGLEMPINLSILATCIHEGVDLPEKVAIIGLKNHDINRVKAHKIFKQIESELDDGSMFETFNTLFQRVQKALVKSEQKNHKK